MNSRLKAIAIFAVYTFLVLVCTVLYFVFFTDAESVLAPDAFVYKLNKGFVYFFNLVPAVLITAEIFGFSWFFGISSSGKEKRFSSILLGHLKTILIVCVSCVIICFIVKEALVPIVQDKISIYEGRARNFREYTELAIEYNEDGEYEYAWTYAQEALMLYPGADEENEEDKEYPDLVEARNLVKEIEPKYLELRRQEIKLESDADAYDVGQNEIHAYSYLQLAVIALKASDYVNAHYYANMAAKITGRDDQNLQLAKEIMAYSWEMLASKKDSFDEDLSELYERKIDAYMALERGDVLNAYYKLLKLKQDYPKDPDIDNYYNETLEQIESLYFFRDETIDKRDFEAANNIYFSVKKPDGQVDLILISGVSIVKDTDQFVQYFRNFSVTSFSAEGHTKQFFSVPYAKMTAQLASSLEGETSVDGSQYIPVVFLNAIDRNSDNKRNTIKPRYKYKQAEDPYFYVIDIPFGDLVLIRQACGGLETMPFVSLFKFASKAEKYGFPAEVYFSALAKRVCYPFIILIFMIFFAVISFNYRLLSGHMFRFSWLLLFPVMTVGIHFLMVLAEYLESILAISLYSVMGGAMPIGMLGISILLVLVVCFRFMSVHGE